MTTEEKQLLFKDICARLPYGVIVHSLGLPHEQKLVGYIPDIEKYNIKPYLRSISNMTEEEKNEYFGRTMTIDIVETSQQVINWLLKHHFDYRGLILMGLAIEAPKGMYEIK